MNSDNFSRKKSPAGLMITVLLLCGISFNSAAGDSLYNQARTSAHAGNYAAALQSLDALLGIDSVNTDALLLKGLVFMWQKRFSESIPLFRKVISSTPEYRDAWVSLATSYERNGQYAEACSTCNAATERFESDPELKTLSQRVCRQATAPRQQVVRTETTIIEAHAGAGATLFEQSYDRSPWATFDGGVDIRKHRWGIETVVRAERRTYGKLTRKGGEVEVAPRVQLHPKLTTGLRVSLSPYSLVDTLFAARGITAEINGGLPGNIEVDGAARFRWYGLLFSPMFSLGIGNYWGNFLIGGRLFIATFEKDAYFSGMVELRRFSSRQESTYGLVSFALGRTPYESGALTKNGYLSFVEAACRTRLLIRHGYSIMPSVSVTGEQITIRDDINNDTINDLRRSSVRLKLSAMLTIFIQRSIK